MPSGIYKRIIGVNCVLPSQGFQKGHKVLPKWGFQKGHKLSCGKNNSMYGKKLSKEHKRKIGESGIGRIVSKKTREKIRQSHLGKKLPPFTKKHKEKLRQSHLGRSWGHHTRESKEKIRQSRLGEKHWRWNPNRELLKRNLRNDPEYKQWVRKVKLRDKQTCLINDENCKGYNIVHHIFPWRKYPKLRYELTNGITLCQAHHRQVHKTRAEEERFKKLFSYLVNQK